MLVKVKATGRVAPLTAEAVPCGIVPCCDDDCASSTEGDTDIGTAPSPSPVKSAVGISVTVVVVFIFVESIAMGSSGSGILTILPSAAVACWIIIVGGSVRGSVKGNGFTIVNISIPNLVNIMTLYGRERER